MTLTSSVTRWKVSRVRTCRARRLEWQFNREREEINIFEYLLCITL